MNKYRTLEEYKEEVFDKLDEKTKLEWLYEMSERLCKIEEVAEEYKAGLIAITGTNYYKYLCKREEE